MMQYINVIYLNVHNINVIYLKIKYEELFTLSISIGEYNLNQV